jgi:prepilin-type N-terminal cleavage/methylation domain-containing protein/prepilin-type processing-associated H-X9-DG protein
MKNPRSRVNAFTLIELLVVLAIIVTLATLTISVVGRITAQSRTTKCANFMRQLGSAAILYAGDHEMTLPFTVHQRRQGEKSWTITLQEYANGKATFRCPDDEDKKRPYTYVINDFLTPNPAGAPELDFSRLARLERPAATFLFAEASPAYAKSDHFHFTGYQGTPLPPGVFKDQIAVERHAGSANYVFADGHMETLSWEHVRKLLATPGVRLVDPTMEEITP